MTRKTPKLAIVATYAGHHFVPVYQRLAQYYGVELKVFYLSVNGVKEYYDKDFGVNYSYDLPMLEGYQYEFVNSEKIIHNFGFFEVDRDNINQLIADYEPDFIWLNGYWAMVSWRVLIKKWLNKFSKVHSKKDVVQIIYSSDSNLNDHRSYFKKIIKQIFVRFFIKNCDHYISVSEQNRRYLEHYGALKDCIEDACYPIDTQRLVSQRNNFSEQDRSQLRAQYGIADSAFVIIFSGKLIDHKRPIDLVHAIAELKEIKTEKPREYVILYMGDGNQREEILDIARQEGIEKQVVIAGFIKQSEIARYLFAADALALPSQKEPFGAVVAEALPFGLPIIAADRIGAVGVNDAAQPERNAIVYPWGDIKALSVAIQRLSTDVELYEGFRQHSFSIVEANDADVYSRVIVKFLKNNNY